MQPMQPMHRSRQATRPLVPAALAAGSLFLSLLLPLAPARAGQPLICDVFDIGQAPSLPWRGGRDGALPPAAYGGDRLVPDTLALLGAKTPVLVRMETLRRAAIYARNFGEQQRLPLGRTLVLRLMARALDAEARGTPDALAWFDAGYFVESLKQVAKAEAEGSDGYGWVVKALRLRGSDAEMEYAAMLIARESPRRPGRHWPRVHTASKQDPALARQLEASFGPLP
jgi:hypothetical protein